MGGFFLYYLYMKKFLLTALVCLYIPSIVFALPPVDPPPVVFTIPNVFTEEGYEAAMNMAVELYPDYTREEIFDTVQENLITTAKNNGVENLEASQEDLDALTKSAISSMNTSAFLQLQKLFDTQGVAGTFNGINARLILTIDSINFGRYLWSNLFNFYNISSGDTATVEFENFSSNDLMTQLDFMKYAFRYNAGGVKTAYLNRNNFELSFPDSYFTDGRYQVNGWGSSSVPSGYVEQGKFSTSSREPVNYFAHYVFYGDLNNYNNFNLYTSDLNSYSKYYLLLYDKNNSSQVTNYTNAINNLSGISSDWTEDVIDINNKNSYCSYVYDLSNYDSTSPLSASGNYYFIVYVSSEKIYIPLEYQEWLRSNFYQDFTGTRSDSVSVSDFSNVPVNVSFLDSGYVFFNGTPLVGYVPSVTITRGDPVSPNYYNDSFKYENDFNSSATDYDSFIEDLKNDINSGYDYSSNVNDTIYDKYTNQQITNYNDDSYILTQINNNLNGDTLKTDDLNSSLSSDFNSIHTFEDQFLDIYSSFDVPSSPFGSLGSGFLNSANWFSLQIQRLTSLNTDPAQGLNVFGNFILIILIISIVFIILRVR